MTGNDASQPARVMSACDSDDPRVANIFAHLADNGRKPSVMHRVLALSPAVLEAHYGLALALRHETALDRAYCELAILRTAQLEGGAYPFSAHQTHARNAGVTKEQVDALEQWRSSPLFDEGEKAVLAYVDAMAERREVPDGTYAALADFLNPQEIVELTVAVGHYAAVSRISCGLAMGS